MTTLDELNQADYGLNLTPGDILQMAAEDSPQYGEALAVQTAYRDECDRLFIVLLSDTGETYNLYAHDLATYLGEGAIITTNRQRHPHRFTPDDASNEPAEQTCPWCDGTGGEPLAPCGRCNGDGTIPNGSYWFPAPGKTQDDYDNSSDYDDEEF